jgi:hypothetical protein
LLDLEVPIWPLDDILSPKNPLARQSGANLKAPRNLTAKIDLVRQYEALCRLREKVRALSAKIRSSRPKGRD